MTEVVEYESDSHRLRTLTWPEATAGEITEFIGEGNVHVFSGGIQVQGVDGEWITLRDGWLVTLTDKDELIIMSPGSLRRYHRV